ncbi:site-specific integrase [Nonomuraea sp. NBC_00507]|uniref:tyrosine-type recombinase/integrase n=1 Tax=unclassified Nonomuraea TaxID=2593643 RepID=UPI002E18CE18
MAGLSRWLGERGMDCSAVRTPLLKEFVADRRAGGCRDGLSLRALRPLTEYLQKIGIAPLPGREQALGPVESFLAEYAVYLARERGLVSATIQREADLIRPFLTGRIRDGRLNLETLTAVDVTAFILACGQNVAPATVQRTATALRSLLRFLHLRGVTGSSLVGAVPTAANWKLSGLPKYLTSEQVTRLLASCDLTTPVGRRDRAMLLMLTRLGLRAGEVATLRLNDIDWRRGEIVVRGKGNRHDRLPLPVDVGEAVVAYLSAGRPAPAKTRAVFVGIRAPHRPLTRGAVTQAVARASRRCGMGTIFAHRLRHTAATSMLHAGASLEEIGQVLRHQHAITTAQYAKVDYEGLRALARPWPGEST